MMVTLSLPPFCRAICSNFSAVHENIFRFHIPMHDAALVYRRHTVKHRKIISCQPVAEQIRFIGKPFFGHCEAQGVAGNIFHDDILHRHDLIFFASL